MDPGEERFLNVAIIVVAGIVMWLGIFLWCRHTTDVEPVPADQVEETSR